jgi:type VI secretion system secreted protein Hcp
MAYEFYITIEGTRQGKFKGESPRAAHKEKIPGLQFSYGVQAPRDVATGMASGKRQHAPVVAVKEVGASSPQLFQACTTNEVLKSVLFEFVRTTKEGKEEVYFAIKLTNATVASVKQYTAGSAKHSDATDVHELEEAAFTFERVDMEHRVAKTSASDDWAA